MSHHLRGTSAAFAENVFIMGGKGHGNYGRWSHVSTLRAPRVVLLDQPLVFRVLYGNYEAPAPFCRSFLPDFAALIWRQADFSPGDSETGLLALRSFMK